jgi:hypothetical protein
MFKVVLKTMIGEEQIQPLILRNEEPFLTCYIMPAETEEEKERIVEVSTFLQVAADVFNDL